MKIKLVATLCLSAIIPLQANLVVHTIQPAGISSTNVVDRHGRYVGKILPQKHYWVPIKDIPIFLQKAIIAVEDARFYEHEGIDVFGIARAMFKNMAKRRFVEGGSTITQQLIKNKYLSGQTSIDRKVKEARMAIEFEKKYSKPQILEMYLNEIYYGNGATGIAQAARLYFNKSPNEMTDGECVLLAGVPKNPARYNPMGKPDDVLRRRDVVLKRMVDLGVITDTYRQRIISNKASIQKPNQVPHYLAQVRAKLVDFLGADAVERGGLDVTAALDLNLQKQAEYILSQDVKNIAPDLQGALICLDPATGDVLASVGDVNTYNHSMNRAFASKRQPGSTIKPLIYAAALDKGITASSIWSDAPVGYNRGNGTSWRPLNFGKECYGEISLRKALASSNNIIAVKLLNVIGIPYFVDFAKRLGLSLHIDNGLSLALGTDEVTLNDLVQAYTPFVTNGSRVESRMIIKIKNRKNGNLVEHRSVITPVLTPATAFITTQILKDVLSYGTARTLNGFSSKYPSAGKTGTTDNYFDAWFIGYTPQLLTGVWVGYDKPRSGGRGFTGGHIAAPIWRRFMASAMTSKHAADFHKPNGVTVVAIVSLTGELATLTSKKQFEYYITGTEPLCCSKHNDEPPIVPLALKGVS